MRSARHGLLLFLVFALLGCSESKPPAAISKFFSDVTDRAGISFTHHAGGSGQKYIIETMGAGAAVLDYDRDGWMDVFVLESGQIPGTTTSVPANSHRLFRNLGNGAFADVTASAKVGVPSYGQGVAAADYDNDGDTDLYLANFGPNILLRNEGDGTFQDVTASAGVGDPKWSVSTAFFDADQDGDLDLFVVNYLDFTVATHKPCGDAAKGKVSTCHPDMYPSAPDTFYRNRGDGSFEEATLDAGFAEVGGKGLGVVIADLAGTDGLPDVYVANDSTPNFLFVNLGGGKFEEQGLLLGCSHNEDGKTEAGMGVDAGDVNGDGQLDVYVTNLSMESNALYMGGSDGFAYASRVAGIHTATLINLGFGTRFLDVDNDGDRDIVTANGHVMDDAKETNDALSYLQPHQLLLNDGRGGFKKPDDSVAGDITVPRLGRGLVTLDYDDDGRIDVFITHNSDRARLFQNTGPRSSWIGFHLEGRKANRSAVGARVRVKSGGRTQVDEVKAGSSYASSCDLRLHFGLSEAQDAMASVIWPGGETQDLGTLKANQYWHVVQGEAAKPSR